MSAANAALQSKVSQLEHALAASQSEHAAQLQSALDIARADVEALLDGGSPQRQAPLLDVVPAAVTVSVPMVPVSPSPVKPPLDCTACASSCSVEEDASGDVRRMVCDLLCSLTFCFSRTHSSSSG